MREFSLPDVGAVLGVGIPFVAPGEKAVGESASAGQFPLGLRRKPLLRPGAEGGGVVPRHVHHRMVQTLREKVFE